MAKTCTSIPQQLIEERQKIEDPQGWRNDPYGADFEGVTDYIRQIWDWVERARAAMSSCETDDEIKELGSMIIADVYNAGFYINKDTGRSDNSAPRFFSLFGPSALERKLNRQGVDKPRLIETLMEGLGTDLAETYKCILGPEGGWISQDEKDRFIKNLAKFNDPKTLKRLAELLAENNFEPSRASKLVTQWMKTVDEYLLEFNAVEAPKEHRVFGKENIEKAILLKFAIRTDISKVVKLMETEIEEDEKRLDDFGDTEEQEEITADFLLNKAKGYFKEFYDVMIKTGVLPDPDGHFESVDVNKMFVFGDPAMLFTILYNVWRDEVTLRPYENNEEYWKQNHHHLRTMVFHELCHRWQAKYVDRFVRNFSKEVGAFTAERVAVKTTEKDVEKKADVRFQLMRKTTAYAATKLHIGEFNVQQARDYLIEKGMVESEAEKRVNEFSVSPIEALTYYFNAKSHDALIANSTEGTIEGALKEWSERDMGHNMPPTAFDPGLSNPFEYEYLMDQAA